MTALYNLNLRGQNCKENTDWVICMFFFTHTQITARLKRLLTQAGTSFTSYMFDSDEGIEGLRPRIFVSSCLFFSGAISSMCTVWTVSPYFTIHTLYNVLTSLTNTFHFTYALFNVGVPIKDFHLCHVFSTCLSTIMQGEDENIDEVVQTKWLGIHLWGNVTVLSAIVLSALLHTPPLPSHTSPPFTHLPSLHTPPLPSHTSQWRI